MVGKGAQGLFPLTGSENNRPHIGGRTELLGDPRIKPEKPYTIIGFPGGDVEISRTEDGDYWVHVAVRDWESAKPGTIVAARIDAAARYADAANAVLNTEIEQGGVQHIAFLIRPHKKG